MIICQMYVRSVTRVSPLMSRGTLSWERRAQFFPTARLEGNLVYSSNCRRSIPRKAMLNVRSSVSRVRVHSTSLQTQFPRTRSIERNNFTPHFSIFVRRATISLPLSLDHTIFYRYVEPYRIYRATCVNSCFSNNLFLRSRGGTRDYIRNIHV